MNGLLPYTDAATDNVAFVLKSLEKKSWSREKETRACINFIQNTKKNIHINFRN